MAPGTLLEAQTSALLTLLNLNEAPSSTSTAPSANGTRASSPTGQPGLSSIEGPQGPLVWKVLVLDDQSKDILATSLRVQDLREQGVTLHMWVFERACCTVG